MVDLDMKKIFLTFEVLQLSRNKNFPTARYKMYFKKEK